LTGTAAVRGAGEEENMKRSICLVFVLAACSAAAVSETVYRLPPKEITQIIDTAPAPEVVVSPARDAVLLADYEGYPPIAFVSQPMLRLAGLRIAPQTSSRQRLRRFTGLSILLLDGSPARRIGLPEGAKIGLPVWSHDGKRLAFTRDVADGVELWTADASTGKAGAVASVRLNDVLGRPFSWLRDNRRLLAWLVPAGRGAAPESPRVPAGPVVQETAGKVSQMATFEDLLKDTHDEDLFEHYATAQLAVVDTASGAVIPVGQPGMFLAAEFSPDERYLLVTRLKKPFSYRVPYFFFTRSVEILDPAGKSVRTVADLPISDEIPRQGVPSGPRAVEWQPLRPATLVWVEALDGGDPLKKAPNRERVMRLTAPFSESPAELFRVKHRFTSFAWTAKVDEALLAEYDRDRRWRTVSLVNLAAPAAAPKVVFDLSANDAYKDPGTPVLDLRPDGQRVLLKDGDAIYLAGPGATESGNRPFLDRMDLKTLRKERLFRCGEKGYEQFVSFAGASRRSILLRSESKTDPPNYFVLDVKSGRRKRVTDFPDTTPQVTKMSKELIRYSRKDGVALSGTLYLPPDYKPGTRLPLIIWAYPLEYSDSDTAGQVRGSSQTYTRLNGATPIFFALHGYAVLNDATMPVVGDPETVNNTYIEQITDSARAAIEKLDSLGVVDRGRVCIAGHSYGAFMAANLLAHSDLFAAGIARSGAYNRSLTPFGFQTERRSYWEATDLYTKISPFAHADKIKKPLLLIHGEADDNSGTFPIQSERLFEAIRGNGGTARLVLLPNEAHGYRARESILHTLAEMLEWADRYVKNPGTGTAAVATK
jgi:dipeptidyl aminopeptidase/acylaminoacyl peptidase